MSHSTYIIWYSLESGGSREAATRRERRGNSWRAVGTTADTRGVPDATRYPQCPTGQRTRARLHSTSSLRRRCWNRTTAGSISAATISGGRWTGRGWLWGWRSVTATSGGVDVGVTVRLVIPWCHLGCRVGDRCITLLQQKNMYQWPFVK